MKKIKSLNELKIGDLIKYESYSKNILYLHIFYAIVIKELSKNESNKILEVQIKPIYYKQTPYKLNIFHVYESKSIYF